MNTPRTISSSVRRARKCTVHVDYKVMIANLLFFYGGRGGIEPPTRGFSVRKNRGPNTTEQHLRALHKSRNIMLSRARSGYKR